MSLDPALLELLACPLCQGPLAHRLQPESFVCHRCGREFPVVDGIPDFVC